MAVRRNTISRIVFAWELGSNFGHVAELMPVARGMKVRGHEAAMLLRELHEIKGEIAETGVPLLQAPLWLPSVQGLPDPPLSYAEILLRFGYHDAEGLSGLVRAWRAAYELLHADALVASHSPTALLAARTLNLPTVTLGSGFYVPPRVDPVPNMRPWHAVPPERLVHADQWVTSTINRVLEKFGGEPLGSLAELFDVAANLFCTFPELDHYQPRIPEMQRGRYCGSMFESRRGEEVAWPEGPGARVLVYLRPDVRDFDALMSALRSLGCSVLAVVPGLSDAGRVRIEGPSCRVVSGHLHLESVAQDCDLAVSYAGHGFVSAMLALGVPLLLLPTQLEQFLLAMRVQALGAGAVVNPEAPPPDYPGVLHKLLKTPAFAQAAGKFAAKYANFDVGAQRGAIMDTIEQAARQ